MNKILTIVAGMCAGYLLFGALFTSQAISEIAIVSAIAIIALAIRE